MIVVIPARYGSTRLPGKPLQDIAGKPLIQHVYERACESRADTVVVATDDERIESVARGFGARVAMTSPAHGSGTERIAEVVQQLGIGEQEIIVNLQGDEPLMPPRLLDQVAHTLAAHPDAVMATARQELRDLDRLQDPHVVKVVCDEKGYALYFSRAPIPWPREAPAGKRRGALGPGQAFWHVGVYAYRAGFVSRYAAWPPCEMEQAEKLEQLRVLYYGERIIVCDAIELPAHGVDTPADLEAVRRRFAEQGH